MLPDTVTPDLFRFDTATDALKFMQRFTEQGSATISILSQQLNPALYDSEGLIEAISALARQSRRAKIRILVRDTKPLQGVHHRLVALAQRLPSRMTLLKLTESPDDPEMGLFCVDREKLVFFNEESQFVGFANASARAESCRLLEEFDHLWNHYGVPDKNLQRLHL